MLPPYSQYMYRNKHIDNYAVLEEGFLPRIRGNSIFSNENVAADHLAKEGVEFQDDLCIFLFVISFGIGH